MTNHDSDAIAWSSYLGKGQPPRRMDDDPPAAPTGGSQPQD